MGVKRGGLGRGLGALMPEGALGGGGIEVDIDAISPNPSFDAVNGGIGVWNGG